MAFVFRDGLSELLIDFSQAVPVTEPASCVVTGVEWGDVYGVDVHLNAENATVPSHYEVTYALRSGGVAFAKDLTVFREMAPGEIRTESVFGTIEVLATQERKDCEVIQILRRPA